MGGRVARGVRVGPNDDRREFAEVDDDARLAFMTRVFNELSEQAMEALARLAQDDTGDDVDTVTAWARTWNVDAPCVRDEGMNMVAAMRADPEEIHGQRAWRTSAAPQWIEKLRDLNGLPVTATPELEARIAEGRMWEPDDAGSARLVAASKERLLDQDHVRAPIAVDPLRETLEAFLERARNHWRARAQVARQSFTAPRRSKRDLELHLDWLFRYQLRKESFSSISATAGVTQDAVRHAVTRLAKRVGLGLRRVKRGRPPKTKNPDN